MPWGIRASAELGPFGITGSIQQRFDGVDDADTNLKKRVTTLGSWILTIEKRLKMPPLHICDCD